MIREEKSIKNSAGGYYVPECIYCDNNKDSENIYKKYHCFYCDTLKNKTMYLRYKYDWRWLFRAVFTDFDHPIYEITGKELNDIAKQYDLRFAKYVMFKGNKGFLFKMGENVDNIRFTTVKFSPGGLCFTVEELVFCYKTYGDIMVRITIDDDVRVLVEEDHLKADKINIIGKLI